MSNICGHCQHYHNQPFNEDICVITGKVTPYLAQKDCFKEKQTDIMETTQPKTKKCTRCGRELTLDNFNNNKSTAYGLQRWCKECMNKSYKEGFEKKKAKKGISIKVSPKMEEALKKPSPVEEYLVKELTRPLINATDKELVAELRHRGWDVKCTKTTIVEL